MSRAKTYKSLLVLKMKTELIWNLEIREGTAANGGIFGQIEREDWHYWWQDLSKQVEGEGRIPRKKSLVWVLFLSKIWIQKFHMKYIYLLHDAVPLQTLITIDTSDADRIKSENKLFSSALIHPYLSQPKSTHVNLNNPSFAWLVWCNMQIDATEWDRYDYGKNKLVGM